MMKDTKTEKNKLRRYLDDMYIREEASQLLESMRDADHKDILNCSSVCLTFNILKFCSFLTFMPLLIFLKIDVY